MESSFANRSEIVFTLSPQSGVKVSSGKFESQGNFNLERVNELLKENKGEVRSIKSNVEGTASVSAYYVIFIEKNPKEMVAFLLEEDWIESAYLKPESEDPGQF